VRIVVCDEIPGQRQQLAAFVVASAQGRRFLSDTGKLAFNRNLRALLVGMIEPIAYPRRWRYLEQMPINAQGKTTRAMLLALLDARPREPQWQIVEQSERQVKLEVTIPEDLFYFEGHFPQSPILPGVVQLDWAIAVGRRHFVMPPCFRAAAALKFQHVVQPGNVITLELAHEPEKNSLNFKYLSAQGQHSSGRLLFAAAAAPSTQE
jgi:3-hydroxymyristoyl/3-hydroxydecanoyl-(acyl carrier protein) dehydratase